MAQQVNGQRQSPRRSPLSELFAKPSFQDAIRRTFVAAGQAPIPGLKKGLTVYNTYLTHTRNTISRFLLPEGKPEEATGSLATVCQGEVDVATCHDSDEPETDDDVDDDDDVEAEDED